MNPKDFAKQVENLAALDEPVRRRLYRYVVGRSREVSRDEAARATRISRSLAAFHLDKLVEAGLLQATFRRLSGRVGPGAGRPAKLYRRASTQFDLSLPQRRYELAARVLTQALTNIGDEHGLQALRDAARDWGRRLAEEPSVGTRNPVPLKRAAQALEACGFEPRRTSDGQVVLGNCPFASLQADSRELICGMNLALIQGLLSGLELQGVYARLAPRPGMCCVALRGSSDDE